MSLKGKRIAILVEEAYQDMEVHYPHFRLQEEGAETLIVGSGSAPKYHGKYGYSIDVDASIDDIRMDDLDAVIVPGGWAPDRLRMCEPMVDLVAQMVRGGKLVACICRGPWLLASAKLLAGRRVTSFRGIRDDMTNAGAEWVDREVVIDGNIVTSRGPDDLPHFMRAVIALLSR